jgi:hypothetical protein
MDSMVSLSSCVLSLLLCLLIVVSDRLVIEYISMKC